MSGDPLLTIMAQWGPLGLGLWALAKFSLETYHIQVERGDRLEAKVLSMFELVMPALAEATKSQQDMNTLVQQIMLSRRPGDGQQ